MKIKIGIRHNLLYPLMIIIFTFFRKVDTIIMNKYIEFSGSLLLTLIMFLSEFITGLYCYIFYYKKNVSKKKTTNFMKLKLIRYKFKPPDKFIKIYFLIFMAAYFDFVVFILQTNYLPEFLKKESISLDIRVRNSLIISNAIICYYFLRLKIYKHQKFSLSIIVSCFIIVIVSEYFFEQFLKEGNGISFIIVLIFTIINYTFNSFLDVIEKYLLEVDYANPFHLLMMEGLFGFILTVIYSFLEDPFRETTQIYKKENKNDFILLIVFLVIYFITSGGRNIYRIITNKLYSPMARTLTDCFLDPLFIIYYYCWENDFQVLNGKQNIYYFIINLIISIIIVFCGGVYNELFILFCCNLQHETYHQISRRASRSEFDIYKEMDYEDDNDDNIED